MNGISEESERAERHFMGSKIVAALSVNALISVSEGSSKELQWN